MFYKDKIKGIKNIEIANLYAEFCQHVFENNKETKLTKYKIEILLFAQINEIDEEKIEINKQVFIDSFKKLNNSCRRSRWCHW